MDTQKHIRKENYLPPKPRLTRQRRLVLDILKESQAHLEAEDIFILARARDEGISLATIYRALAALKKDGLIEEHKFDQDHGHFETSHPEPHFHFTCQKCGHIIEFDSPEVLEWTQAFCDNAGLEMTDLHLFINGYCANCRTSQANHQPTLSS